MPFHTDIDVIFDSFGGLEKEYNWLITDFELNQYPLDFINKKIIWICGEKLSNIVHNNSIQFIWGVLSGFKKTIKINVNNLEIEPYADNNPNF